MLCSPLVLPTLSNWAPTRLYHFICVRAPPHLTNPWYFYTFRFCKSDGWEMLHRHKLNSHSMQAPLWFSSQLVVGGWLLFRLLPIMSAAQFLFFTCSFLNCDACLFLTDLLAFSCVRDHNASPLCITNGLTWSCSSLFYHLWERSF